MAEEFDIDSCFDGAVSLEEGFIEEGRTEGFRYGQIAGFEDGKVLGLERGFEFGEELGRIYGLALFWCNLLDNTPDHYSKRTRSVITKLFNAIKEFPNSPTDDKYDEKLELIRNTFKQASSLMKIKANAKPKPINEALSF